MFNFEHTKLTERQFEELAQLLTRFKQCYATSKYDVGKIKVELNLPLKATAIFKNRELLEFQSNYKTEYNTYLTF